MEKSPLTVVRTKEINRNTPPSAVSTFLDRLPKTPIDHNSWPAFSYKPQVLFSIAHCNDCILIRYEVQEKTIRAVHNQPNAPVYTDSCVEFFIQPVAGQGYYNFQRQLSQGIIIYNNCRSCFSDFRTNRWVK